MTVKSNKLTAVDLFSEGGEMGARLQQVNWDNTGFGPIDRWPQSLKTTVKICVDAVLPMAIWWRNGIDGDKSWLSSDRSQGVLETICNDAYHLNLGTLSLSAENCSESLLPKVSTERVDVDSAVRSVLATGKTTRLEYQWEIESGSSRIFSFSYSPLLDEGGAVRGVFAAAVERTAQRAVEDTRSRMQAEVLHCEEAMEQSVQKAQQQMNSVLESISDAFIAFDSDWNYTYVNQKAAQLLHQDSQSLIGQPVWRDAFPGKAGTVAYQELNRAMREGVPVVFEEYSPSFEAWFEVHGYPSAEGLSIYFQDVSDRKKAEAAKEKRLAEEQAAREAAEAAIRLKDEFLSVVSHELRSPLNPILGCAELLKKGELSPERRVRALDSIERNARIQAQLINDLLDVSQILQGELVLSKCSVPIVPAIQSTIESLKSEAQAKDIEVKAYLSSPANSVLADPGRLHQILWNLLSNAIKFTPRSGKVIIRTERAGNRVKFSVTDTGKGIHSSFLPYVFDRFRQEDAANTRQFGGLGLGLSIVRHLVELHHGTVEASSPGEDKGATFTFFLPLGSSQAKVVKNGKRKQVINQRLSAESYSEAPGGMPSAALTE